MVERVDETGAVELVLFETVDGLRRNDADGLWSSEIDRAGAIASRPEPTNEQSCRS
jgi:hypothetical protein